MGDVTLRTIGDDELGEFVRATDLAFGFVPPAAHVELERGVVEYDRTLVAELDGVFVGGAAAYSTAMTLPGATEDIGAGRPAPTVPVAAVTNVGVRPTHHRRGLLTSMMARQLVDVAERGDAAAVLLASEAGIYRRFGYGVASEHESLRIDRHQASTLAAPPERHLRLVPQAEAAATLAPAFDRYRQQRPGELSRREAWWECLLSETATWKSFGRGFVVVASEEPDGSATGYALYKVHQRGEVGTWEAEVFEMVASDPETDAALWQYLTTLDLVSSVVISRRPMDEPHRLRLADPRALGVTERHDGLWVRPVDVAGLLSARGYAGQGQVVVHIADPFGRRTAERSGSACPFDVTGTYLVQADAAGTAACTRVEADPDLSTSVADLGALCLGHTTWQALVGAGLVTEHRSGAIALADALFATGLAPHCTTRF
ncbi:GNAT family N-acetyltransferase [Rhabdothermincola salaria]|uniref:GNAT family N-acetyltransferase n=1 Tax=Rhabdothermincola salaria TaxID=2903142 RepID=UPI001E2A9013|nr:GNAT family N-acetyltransferase [Rhabdothermincola salaria]MCD9623722.1 GNAT family N-acetyltransferase [Rhabdothermincola salaria]